MVIFPGGQQVPRRTAGAGVKLFVCSSRKRMKSTPVPFSPSSASAAAPIHVVPAGVWQAARPLGEYALLGCYVGPGFDFSDFRMAKDDAEMRRVIALQGEGFAACL